MKLFIVPLRRWITRVIMFKLLQQLQYGRYADPDWLATLHADLDDWPRSTLTWLAGPASR